MNDMKTFSLKKIENCKSVKDVLPLCISLNETLQIINLATSHFIYINISY